MSLHSRETKDSVRFEQLAVYMPMIARVLHDVLCLEDKALLGDWSAFEMILLGVVRD